MFSSKNSAMKYCMYMRMSQLRTFGGRMYSGDDILSMKASK